MSKYFKNVGTLEELRRQYKELLKQHHPDNGGSEEATKVINVEYEELFKTLKDKAAAGEENNKTSFEQMKWDTTADEKLREVLHKIINFTGIEINIVGCWIWLDGNTYPYREQLSGIGFRWSKARKKWHWHEGEYIKKGNGNITFSEIEHKYGSTKIKSDTRVLLEA